MFLGTNLYEHKFDTRGQMTNFIFTLAPQNRIQPMYLMYVDESGDPGISQYSSPHYILSGLIINLYNWDVYLDRLKKFRKYIKDKYGLPQSVEIHAAELIRINKLTEYAKISKSDRVYILKEYCDQIPLIFDSAKILNVCIDKSTYQFEEGIQVLAWGRLVQAYDAFLKEKAKDKGIIVSDETDGHKVMNKLRKIRVYNPSQSASGGLHDAPVTNIVEDLFQRASHHSFFIQTVDIVSHCLYRQEFPKGSLSKYRMHWQFQKLESVLLKEASKDDKYGIIRK